MTAIPTPVDVLEGAKRALTEKGWTKHVLVDDAGCLCTIGAVQYATFGKAAYSPDYSDKMQVREYRTRQAVASTAIRFIEDVIPEDRIPTYLGERYNPETDEWEDVDEAGDPDVAEFNDDDRTTLDEVLALLDAAIAKARA